MQQSIDASPVVSAGTKGTKTMATKMFLEYQGMFIPADSPAGHEVLLTDLQKARDYSYEALMGDYSIGSIRRAQEEVTQAAQNLTDAGYEIPEW